MPNIHSLYSVANNLKDNNGAMPANLSESGLVELYLSNGYSWHHSHGSIRVGARQDSRERRSPGIINTPLAFNPATGKELVPVAQFAIPRQAESSENRKYVLFVASDDAAFSTASEFVADGGFGLGPIAP